MSPIWDELAPQPVLDRLAERLARESDDTALTFCGVAIGWSELARRIAGAVAWLAARGVDEGERIALALPNGPDFLALFYAVQWCGGVAVPLPPEKGLAGLLADCERVGAALLAGADALPAPEAGIEVWRAPFPVSDAPLPAPRPTETSFLQLTSGSTGEPKVVPITHERLRVNVGQMIAGFEISRADVFVSWLPVHHDMGLILMTQVPLYLGASLHLLPADLSGLRGWMATVAERRGTFTAASDFAYRLCLRLERDPASLDVSSLRVALDAAEPVRASTVEAFERAFGLDRVVVPGYGLAEATVGVTARRPGEPLRLDARGAVALGRGFPGIEIAVLDGDDAEGLGEIGVRGPACAPAYWSVEGTGEGLCTEEGFVRTGDLGYLDADGELFVVGRRKNVILQGGRTLAPREIEEAVEALPDVRRAAAIGVDRGRLEGEQAYVFAEVRPAAVRGREDEVARAIAARFRERLGMRPGRVYLVAPRTLPFTANGKLRYDELRRAYLDGDLRRQGALLFPSY
ncbi:MAG: AMP-binding protein [Thermoanaerobaculia bacterium]